MQVPGLAVVLVGTKGDSATYVRMKRKACADLGIQSFSTDLPEDVTEEDLLKVCQPVKKYHDCATKGLASSEHTHACRISAFTSNHLTATGALIGEVFAGGSSGLPFLYICTLIGTHAFDGT